MIIHAVGPNKNNGEDIKYITEAYVQALTLFANSRYRTMAVCLLSSEIFGFSTKESVDALHNALTRVKFRQD